MYAGDGEEPGVARLAPGEMRPQRGVLIGRSKLGVGVIRPQLGRGVLLPLQTSAPATPCQEGEARHRAKPGAEPTCGEHSTPPVAYSPWEKGYYERLASTTRSAARRSSSADARAICFAGAGGLAGDVPSETLRFEGPESTRPVDSCLDDDTKRTYALQRKAVLCAHPDKISN
jgi:hypothetical protein